MTREFAPSACIVCHKQPPPVDTERTWTYIAGSNPIGAIVCCAACLDVAIARQLATGRVDAVPEVEP